MLKFIYNFQKKAEIFGSKTFSWKQSIAWILGRSVRNATILGMFVLTGFVSAKTYNSLHPIIVHAEPITVEVPIKVNEDIPILNKIMVCESQGTQFDENGQVLMHANNNGTVDSGIMQINLTVWGKKAHDMGYDLTKQEDNIAFGKWIFLNYGTEPWYASKSCWSKK